MFDLSFGFHLISLIAFAGLAWWIVNLKSYLQSFRHWNQYGCTSRFVVGNPLATLREFAHAIDVDIEVDGRLNLIPPTRISLRSCFDLHREAGIRKIKISSDPNPKVSFYLFGESDTISNKRSAIVSDFSGKIQIELVSWPERANTPEGSR